MNDPIKSSNLVLNNNNSDPQNLEGLTLKELRKIAKKNHINLKGKRKKKEITNILQSFFLAKGRPSNVEIINPSFPIISDENGRLNISLWFRESYQSLGFNPLSRFLKSRDVIRMTNQICQKENLKANDVIHKTTDGVFAKPHIALVAASFLSDQLFYDIYNFYLVSLPAEIEKQNERRLQEEASLLLEELGIKINQHVKWESFDIPFAYYLIKINNVVKAGIVGGQENPNKENLDRRLSTHRSLLNLSMFLSFEIQKQ